MARWTYAWKALARYIAALSLIHEEKVYSYIDSKQSPNVIMHSLQVRTVKRDQFFGLAGITDASACTR